MIFVRGTISFVYISFQARFYEVDLFKFHGKGLALVIGVTLGTLNYLFQLLSFKLISATKATLIIYSNPILVVILAYFFLRENVTKYDIYALFMVVFGCYLITKSSETTDHVESAHTNLGYFFAFAC